MAKRMFTESATSEQETHIESKQFIAHHPLETSAPIKIHPALKILVATLGLVLVSALAMLAAFHWYATAFFQESNLSYEEIFGWYRQASTLPAFQDTYEHIVIIGLDDVEGRQNSLLTDTILIASLNREGQVKMLSIPRDLWIKPLQTKINALYYYGERSDTTNGMELILTALTDITGLPLTRTMVVNLEDIRNLIDSVGGIEVEIDRSFTDEKYPLEIELPIQSDEPQYITISFTAGRELMDGQRALAFLRSRFSLDLLEGTDEGRQQRQQRVMRALVQRLTSQDTLTNPQLLGKIFRLIDQDLEKNTNWPDLLSLLLNLKQYQPKITSYSLPTSLTSEAEQAILLVPPITKYGQWVYEPRDENFQIVRSFIQQELENQPL